METLETEIYRFQSTAKLSIQDVQVHDNEKQYDKHEDVHWLTIPSAGAGVASGHVSLAAPEFVPAGRE